MATKDQERIWNGGYHFYQQRWIWRLLGRGRAGAEFRQAWCSLCCSDYCYVINHSSHF